MGFAIDADGRRYSEVVITTATGKQRGWMLGPPRAIGRVLTEDPSGRRVHPSLLFELRGKA